MKFVLIMSHDDQFAGDPEFVRSIHDWIEKQTKTGVRLVGVPLKPPNEAKTIYGTEGARLEPGPFTPGPLHTAAFELIECADLDAAVAVAKSHPMATRATVEVRPVWQELEN